MNYTETIKYEEMFRALLDGKKIQWLSKTNGWQSFASKTIALATLSGAQYGDTQFRLEPPPPPPDKEFFLPVWLHDRGGAHGSNKEADKAGIQWSNSYSPYQGYIKLTRGPDDQVKGVEFIPYKK